MNFQLSPNQYMGPLQGTEFTSLYWDLYGLLGQIVEVADTTGAITATVKGKLVGGSTPYDIFHVVVEEQIVLTISLPLIGDNHVITIDENRITFEEVRDVGH